MISFSNAIRLGFQGYLAQFISDLDNKTSTTRLYSRCT